MPAAHLTFTQCKNSKPGSGLSTEIGIWFWDDAVLYLRGTESSAIPLQKHDNKHGNVWNVQWKIVF
jgi:hypothetical protein